jgi:hypothetical protein
LNSAVNLKMLFDIVADANCRVNSQSLWAFSFHCWISSVNDPFFPTDRRLSGASISALFDSQKVASQMDKAWKETESGESFKFNTLWTKSWEYFRCIKRWKEFVVFNIT